jgi:hypothetical protein
VEHLNKRGAFLGPGPGLLLILAAMDLQRDFVFLIAGPILP